MSSFEAIKIIGIDPDRAPRVRKESYIDLFFLLSAEAPQDWCEDFNALGRQISPAVKVDKSAGNCVETYVNDMNDIPKQLDSIKETMRECNTNYLEKIKQREAAQAASNAALQGEDGAQSQLNQIVEGLKFDD